MTKLILRRLATGVCLIACLIAGMAIVRAQVSVGEPARQREATTRPATSRAATRPSVPVARAAEAARAWIATPAADERVESGGRAVEIRALRFEQPKPLRVWVVKIDVSAAGVRAIVTPPAEGLTGEEAKFETRCENTLEFAQRTGVALAINTSAFGPFRAKAGMPVDVVGLAAADGRVYSPTERDHAAMYVSKDGRVALKARPGRRPVASQPAGAPATSQPTIDEDVWQVVPGFRMLIDDGAIVVRQREADSNFGGVNPRTAVATDREGTTLWIAVVDGRQPGVSEGMTLVELAVLFESLGAWDALNLDGGGSTTLVLRQADGTHSVLNTPVGQKAPGSLRQVANNLGFFFPER